MACSRVNFTVVHWCTDNSQTYVESPSCTWTHNTAENKRDMGKTANEEGIVSYDILRSHNIQLAKQECHFQGETLVGVCCGKDFVKGVQSSHVGL